MTTRWSSAEIGDLSGRVVLITGANAGLGFASADALARHGAELILGCRDRGRAAQARDALQQRHPSAQITVVPLDLADLDSVRAAADEVAGRWRRVDILLASAGLMGTPDAVTTTGIEEQFAVNHLGHAALTIRLLPQLCAAEAGRIVVVTSLLAGLSRLRLQRSGVSYLRRWGRYAVSKNACLLFALELDRRLHAAAAGPIAVAAHPGLASTSGFGPASRAAVHGGTMRSWSDRLAQSAPMGALPQLYAATAPGVHGGELFGPRFGLWGAPVRIPIGPHAANTDAARRLWVRSARLTGLTDQLRELGLEP